MHLSSLAWIVPVSDWSWRTVVWQSYPRVTGQHAPQRVPSHYTQHHCKPATALPTRAHANIAKTSGGPMSQPTALIWNHLSPPGRDVLHHQHQRQSTQTPCTVHTW